MRKLLVLSGALLLMGVAGTAQTVEGMAKPYFASLKLGWNMPKDMTATASGFHGYAELDKGVSVSAAVGMNLRQRLRLELELSTRSSDIAKLKGTGNSMRGDIKTRALMGNAYYDFPAVGAVQPYLTAGVGVARHDISSTASNAAGALSALSGNKHDNTFLYHAGLGLSYSLSQTTSADLGYRYLKSSDIEMASATYVYGTHELMAGVRVEF
ncbi:MAG: porin family protein [Magnetococcales bacterium]|nr:porin family protein [Magnetococcales bacterium]